MVGAAAMLTAANALLAAAFAAAIAGTFAGTSAAAFAAGIAGPHPRRTSSSLVLL